MTATRKPDSLEPTKRPAVLEVLRSIRRSRGITLAQASDLSQLNLSQISQIENGRVDPRVSSIEALARALGLEIALVPAGTGIRPAELDPGTIAAGSSQPVAWSHVE